MRQRGLAQAPSRRNWRRERPASERAGGPRYLDESWEGESWSGTLTERRFELGRAETKISDNDQAHSAVAPDERERRKNPVPVYEKKKGGHGAASSGRKRITARESGRLPVEWERVTGPPDSSPAISGRALPIIPDFAISGQNCPIDLGFSTICLVIKRGERETGSQNGIRNFGDRRHVRAFHGCSWRLCPTHEGLQ
jgi:hypothetical protein